MDAGPQKVTNFYQTQNAGSQNLGVRLRGISFVVERERTQTNS